MTRVEFRRLDDRYPPLRELLFVDGDGSFRMWRSGAEAVGRFAGRLPDPAAFAALTDAAARERPPEAARLPADAVTDELRVGDAALSAAPWDRGSGAWGALLGTVRGLLDELLAQPAAAVAITLPEPGVARLEHRGTAVLPIELGAMTVLVEAYGDTGRVGLAQATPPALHHVDAGPGWVLDIPIPPIDAPAGSELLVRITFVADDEGVSVPVQAGASSPIR